jgi:chitodextrinase
MKQRVFNQKRLFLTFCAAVVFGGFGTYLLATSLAATVNTMNLSPATANVGLGSTVSIAVTENSGTAVNAGEADLTYDATKLQFVSVDTTSTAFSFVANCGAGQQSCTNGEVYLGFYTTTPVTGQQNIAVVTFKTIGLGSTSIAFDPATSGIADATTNTSVLTGTTGSTLTVSDTTAPGTPTGLTSPSQTATSVALSWTASTDDVAVTGYKIFRGGTQIATAAGTSYTNTGLTPSTNYSYTVAAYDAAGNTSAQTTALAVSSKADTTAPSAPTSLTSGTTTLTSIPLTWTAATDDVAVTRYNVFRNGTQVGNTAATTYSDTGLTPGTSYTYTVVALDAAGNTSTTSNSLVVSTKADTTAPTVPTNLASPTQTVSTITLSWTSSTDDVAVTGYKIFRGGTQIATTTNTTYTDSGLTPGASYSYTVAAYDGAGNTSAQTTAVSTKTVLKPGDANHDGIVDYLDLSLLAGTWQSRTDLRADFNADGVVNYLDLSILAANYGK